MSRLIDWKNVCLVCLKKDENRSIFERDNNSNLIADIIIKCADIFIEKDTNQPKSICLQCLDNLNVTHKFHRNYEQSDSIIKALLSTNHQEFQIKDLSKTTPFRGAQQKESPQNEILHIEESANSDEINIKHEIIENDIVDDTHDNDNPPSIDLGDNIDTEVKFVLKDPVEACFQGSATELNDVETNKSNTICEICNRAFTCQANLNIHMRRHNNERPFNCDHCDKAYVTSGDLRRHMKVHTGEKPYGCKYCDRSFNQNAHRKTHERMHTGERPFVCPTCGKSFAYSHYLSNHRRIHTGVKKFMCEECGKGFNRKEPLETHARRHQSRDKLDKSSEHKQKKVLEKEILQIKECTKSNENTEHDVVDDTHDNDNSPCINLEDDVDTAAKLVLKNTAEACFQGNAIEQNDLKSNETNKIKQDANDEITGQLRSDSKVSIETSRETPSRKTVYKNALKICEICNHAFTCQAKLTIHMTRHNIEQLFSCDRCDKAYVSSAKLRLHMRGHTAEKPYECQYCDRRFTQKGHRKTHERMHTGERPFVCPTCGKSFAYSHVLSNHRRIHTGIKKFMCKECGKGFNKRERFERHVDHHLSRDKLDKSPEHKQKKVLEREFFHIEECARSNELNIKHEIIENDVIDDSHDNDNPPSIDLGDNIEIGAKFVLKDPVGTCFQSSAIEQNDMKANESNKIKQDANDEISGGLRSESKGSIENSCDKPSHNKVNKKGLKICEICNHAFTCQAKLNIHMRRHKNERPFNCDHCDKAFVTSGDLRRHIKVHTGEKPYECQYCDHRFAEKSSRKTHERMHTGERPFVCPTCGKNFTYRHALMNHRRIHTGVKKFMCEECGKGYNRREPLERHVRRHLSRDKLDKSSEHKQKKVLEKEIFQIEESAKSNEINIKHEIIENDVVDDTLDNDNLSCIDLRDNINAQAKLILKDSEEACFQGSAIELNDVKANKSNEICGICNRAYKQLDIHMRSHNNERPYSCDRCDKAYVSFGELRIHMRGHTGEKPYECQYCERRFKQKSHRKNHERIHTGERPFVCPTCGKSFAYSHVLSNHRRIHAGVKKFMCEECGKGFNTKEPLERHVRRHMSRDKLNKSPEHKQNKVLDKEIFQIEECAKSNETKSKRKLIN